MSRTALAKPPTVVPTVGVTLTITKAEVEALTAEAAPGLDSMRAITARDIESDEDVRTADEWLTSVARELDETVKLRQENTAPLKKLAAEIDGWFRPYVKALEDTKAHLTGVIGAYRLAKFEAAEALKRATAAKLEATGSVDVQAIVQAQELTAGDGAAATTRYAWAVKRVAMDLLPEEYKMPDMKKIEGVAKAFPGEGDPPVIPGVVFERVPVTGARIK